MVFKLNLIISTTQDIQFKVGLTLRKRSIDESDLAGHRSGSSVISFRLIYRSVSSQKTLRSVCCQCYKEAQGRSEGDGEGNVWNFSADHTRNDEIAPNLSNRHNSKNRRTQVTVGVAYQSQN